MAVLVWEIQVTHLQFFEASIFLCAHGFCITSLRLLLAVSAVPFQINYIVLTSTALWLLAVMQGYNGIVTWNCCLALLLISIAHFTPYFYLGANLPLTFRTSGVIGFVCVGSAKINL